MPGRIFLECTTDASPTRKPPSGNMPTTRPCDRRSRIVRTAGEGKKSRYFVRDLHILLKTWEGIQSKMLNDRADEQGIRNITPVLGTFVDPRLPKGKFDMIFCADVYHEFSYPEQMLAAMREALAPKGQLVLLEFRGEDPNVPIKPEHKMTKAQVLKELRPNGFKLDKQYEKLPWQHLLFFGRDETWKKGTP